MMRSSRNILMAIGIASCSLIGLVLIQFQILHKDVELKQEQIDFAIPAILMDVHDRWYYNSSLKDMIKEFRGTEEFSLTNREIP